MIKRAHLRQFIAVVDAGNFTRAAERLGLTQPTLSAGIAELERITGARLFLREKRRVRLTDAGNRLLAHARAIEREFRAAEAGLSGAAAMAEPLRLGVLLSIAVFPLLAPQLWHHHFGKITAAWALAFVLPYAALDGLGATADYRATNVRFDAGGTQYQLEVGERKLLVRLPLIGRFNVLNSLAAVAGATACGLNLREAVANLARAPQVPGRLESVAGRRAFRVFVDYAHTPDALENALTTLRELGPRRLLVVFGCGGDRDAGKRPLMGGVAARLADYAILTSDNPRSEPPAAILEEIRRGFTGGAAHEVLEDRRQAIGRAIELAQDGDIVLIAGKGHENYQIVGDRTIEFDDRQVARRFVEQKPAGVVPEPGGRERRPPSRGERRSS